MMGNVHICEIRGMVYGFAIVLQREFHFGITIFRAIFHLRQTKISSDCGFGAWL